MLDLFKKISETNSPGEKVRLLVQHPGREELKTVLRLATDPFITFGVTSADGYSSSPHGDPYKVLERMSRREITGNSAREILENSLSSEEEAELITRILKKDLRCGVGEKLVLQAFPGLIRQFSVMRAVKYEKLGRGKHYIEPKYDGLRCVAMVQGQSVTLLSRNGLEFTSSDHLKGQILALSRGDGVFDGELTSGNFNETSGAVRRKYQQNEDTVYNIFDYLTMDEWKSPMTPYYQRRFYLESLFEERQFKNLKLVPSYVVGTEDEVVKYYNRFLDLKYEGGIIKKGEGLYRMRKHRDWMKLKEINEVDARVEGLIEGEGKYKGMLGAFIIKYQGRKNHVGTGFSDDERKLWWEQPHLIKGKIAEVHFHQVTPDGNLRHARLHRIREDKDQPD